MTANDKSNYISTYIENHSSVDVLKLKLAVKMIGSVAKNGEFIRFALGFLPL